MVDPFLDQIVQGYKVEAFIGEGAIGKVYYAYNREVNDDRAIKFIPMKRLKDGWKNEITKANKLKSAENVVKYHAYEEMKIESNDYLCVMWDYIENDCLKTLIDTKKLSINLLVDIIVCCLSVKHACMAVNIVHADWHSGNILIQKGSDININPTFRKIWITDFSYITQHSQKEYLDDFVGINRIIQDSLRSINYNSLDGEGKRIHTFLKEEFSKYLLEQDPTQGIYVRKPKELLNLFNMRIKNINDTKSYSVHSVGDYLAAEHLGDYYDEWKALFVPKSLAIGEIVSRNINVLTGLRGCGKTMLFRRLSSYFNCKLGNSNIPGSDGFYGFYLNARNIAEAFPWLPDDKINEAHKQVINHFNLSWCLEILNWLKEFNMSEKCDLTFLNSYFSQYYHEYFSSGNNEQNIIYLREFIGKAIINNRLGSHFKESDWPVASYDFLESFVKNIKINIPKLQNKPFYFFLDDYSDPIVKRSIQLILNPILFRRSADVIFKISTESVESFFPVGLNGKVLEETADYTLIDCGTIALRNNNANKDILFSILQPRIDRHHLLKDRNINLDKLLGETSLNNEDLAKAISDGKDPRYKGTSVFCNMWSSDVREMIKLLAEMINSEKKEQISKNVSPIISDNVQHSVYMEIGGQFINLLNAATSPESRNYDIDKEHIYGQHLVEIVKSFQEIASHEMKTKTSKNQQHIPIKKARKIEITNADNEDLPDDVRPYYRGLIRYGIFIRDNKGKSVRGRVAPRLYLRGSLIPFFKITFSKRDSISMSWDNFITFLREPSAFAKRWKENNVCETSLYCEQLNLFEGSEML
jgi:serine/threonine protein kinase